MRREMLSPEERDEYDAVIEQAAFDDHGQRRSTGEAGQRLRELIEDADQAGRPWAQWVREDDQEAGHQKRLKAWIKARESIKVYDRSTGTLTRKPAEISVKHASADGSEAYQLTLWRQLDWAQVQEVLRSAQRRISSERINADTARKLLALREQAPESSGPLEACEMLDIDFDSYIASDEDEAV